MCTCTLHFQLIIIGNRSFNPDTETVTLSRSPLNISGMVSNFLAPVLDRKDTTLDAVDQQVSRLEVGVDGPGAVESGAAADGVVLGTDVEKASLLEAGTGGVLGNRRDVDDAQAGSVVALVRKAVDDVLVVVDGLGRALVDAGEDGLGQVGHVDDVSGGPLVGGRTGALLLVELVVQKQVAHVVGRQPALVGVGCAVVRRRGQLDGARPVGHVHDGERVLVVVEADLVSGVLGHRALVDDTLGIVHVAILGDTAGVLWREKEKNVLAKSVKTQLWQS